MDLKRCSSTREGQSNACDVMRIVVDGQLPGKDWRDHSQVAALLLQSSFNKRLLSSARGIGVKETA
jgi:hypothetical protein